MCSYFTLFPRFFTSHLGPYIFCDLFTINRNNDDEPLVLNLTKGSLPTVTTFSESPVDQRTESRSPESLTP